MFKILYGLMMTLIGLKGRKTPEISTKYIERKEYDDGSMGHFEKLNDQYHGIWKITWPNGQLQWEQCMDRGIIHGYCRKWNSEGQILEKSYYWKGLLHGSCRKWYDNGHLKEDGQWNDGIIIHRTLYYIQENLEIKDYQDGSKEYIDKSNGQYHGLWKIFWPGGQLKVEKYMRKGAIHGYFREWTSEGQMIEESYYWRGMLDGVSKKWYDSGILKSEELWDMGFILSRKLYDHQGTLIEAKQYQISELHPNTQASFEVIQNYKLQIKHRKFDPEIHSNAQEILEEFKKIALVMKTEEINISNHVSLLWDIHLCKEGEDWPELRGTHLSPMLQLKIQDLPQIPDCMRDIAYLMIFIIVPHTYLKTSKI